LKGYRSLRQSRKLDLNLLLLFFSFFLSFFFFCFFFFFFWGGGVGGGGVVGGVGGPIQTQYNIKNSTYHFQCPHQLAL
jgi:cellobiose-specific phosphotransferase system component IIC